MKKYIRSGYVLIHNPTHHRAEKNGLVYEHVLVAEQKLGRLLKDLEVVHHEDENRKNNNPENLFVFATNSDHARFHKNGVKILVDDYYISPELNTFETKCIVCGCVYKYNPTQHTGKFCSKECHDKGQRRVERPLKEELYNMILKKSFVEIGKEYGVSDNAVRKWCKCYGLPYRKKDLKSIKPV